MAFVFVEYIDYGNSSFTVIARNNNFIAWLNVFVIAKIIITLAAVLKTD